MTRTPAVFLLAAAALLAGCQTTKEIIDGKKIDYKSATQQKTLPPLEVPPDLTAPNRDNRYAVPDTAKPATTTLSGYQAERAQQAKAAGQQGGVLPSMEGMRVERSGNQRWLVINEKPERLWPLVKEFWQENGFIINLDLPEAGVMETDWAENRAKIPQDWLRRSVGKMFDSLYSTSERDKFRTRFERGADGKSTEVYISHRGMIENYKDERTREGATIWQPRPTDPELEAEFLRRLMVRLGTREDEAKQSLAVAPPPRRSELKKTVSGAETLLVYEPFDRTWRRVGLALDRVGFTVEDRDRQKGLYFVRYADPDADTKDRRKKESVITRIFTRDEDKVQAQQYRVQVKQASDNSEIQVFNKEGAAENSQTSRRILSLLNEQLK